MSKKTEITVADQSVRVVEYRGQRVVTFAMIDAVHQRPEGTAKRTFHDNRERFIEGEDFVSLTSDAIRTESLTGVFPPRTPNGFIFTESGYLMLTKTFSDDLAWQVQRQLVRNYFRKDDPAPKVGVGRPAPTMNERQIRAARALLLGYAEDLKISKVSIAGAYLRLEEKAGFKGMLPNYVSEGPDAETKGSEAPLSATELLRRKGIDISARAFNQLLHAGGFIEEKTRPSSKGGEKRYWSVTNFEYGKNETSPANPRETQPLWYESKFDELLAMILPAHGSSHAH